MKYPKYVFLTYGSLELQRWADYGEVECSPEDIADVLHYSLAATHFNATSKDKPFYHHCYDATWALAYALNSTLEEVVISKVTGESTVSGSGSACDPATDSMYSFQSRIFTPQLMKMYMESTNFVGKSVREH